MELPAELRAALDRALAPVSTTLLAALAERQSDTYRTRKPASYAAPVVGRSQEALAYAAWRMPATYGAIAAALDAVVERRPDFAPSSHLDLGSGPGTAVWAAWARMGAVDRALALEQSGAFRDLAASLLGEGEGEGEKGGGPASVSPIAGDAPLPRVEWRDADLADAGPWAAPAPGDRFDLVTLCYVAGELDERTRARVVERAWSHCADLLLVVEPGTRAGYARLMSMREALTAAGAHVVAPCPHASPCPLAADDWCHFAERVARSRVHRRVKGADLGYEDEKYAYLAVARAAPPSPPAARVLRRPEVHKAAVELQLCTPAGLASRTVRRRDKADYRAARKLRGGDAWPEIADLDTPPPEPAT